MKMTKKSEKFPARQWVRLVVYAVVVFMSACTPRDNFNRLQLLNGPDPEINQDNLTEFSGGEQKVVENLASIANLPHPPPGDMSPIDYWNGIVDAGTLYVDKECDQYINALFWFDRAGDSAKTATATTGAATAAALGVLGSAASAISLTAVAFGLASSLIDTGSNTLLYNIEPSAIRVILKKSQEAYLSQIAVNQQNGVYKNKAKALSAVQGYLALCLPASLETMINSAVVTATIDVDTTSKDSAKSPIPALLVNQSQPVVSGPGSNGGGKQKSGPQDEPVKSPSNIQGLQQEKDQILIDFKRADLEASKLIEIRDAIFAAVEKGNPGPADYKTWMGTAEFEKRMGNGPFKNEMLEQSFSDWVDTLDRAQLDKLLIDVKNTPL